MNDVTQTELDWFVEGEMLPAERDDLFARLDADSTGWKRCALALLEQQALRRSLATIGATSEAGPEVHVAAKCNESAIRKLPHAGNAQSRKLNWHHLAVAVVLSGFLVGLGYWLSDSMNRSDRSGMRQPAVASQSPTDSLADEPAHTLSHSLSQGMVNKDPAVVLALSRAVDRLNVEDCEIVALISLQLKEEALVLPVIESEILSKQLTELPPPRMPPELTKKLTKSGFQIRPRRQFLSVSHQDGTNEVLPLNMLDCRYVGNSVF